MGREERREGEAGRVRAGSGRYSFSSLAAATTFWVSCGGASS
jgi:hypothetical protein